jgi:hypothetical protein
MSVHAPNEPGGNNWTSVATVKKVPHVHGYRSVSIDEFINFMPITFLGYERFWIRRNLPGFGIRESGDV